MNIRKLKKAQKNIQADVNPEEAAKIKLIEFSNFDFQFNDNDLFKSPDITLTHEKKKSPSIKSKPRTRQRNFRYSEKIQIKPPTPQKKNRKTSYSNYNTNRTYMNLSFQNAITISNFVLFGNSETQKHPRMNKSQYVVRVQRNANKIKRNEERRLTASEFWRRSRQQPRTHKSLRLQDKQSYA